MSYELKFDSQLKTIGEKVDFLISFNRASMSTGSTTSSKNEKKSKTLPDEVDDDEDDLVLLDEPSGKTLTTLKRSNSKMDNEVADLDKESLESDATEDLSEVESENIDCFKIFKPNYTQIQWPEPKEFEQSDLNLFLLKRLDQILKETNPKLRLKNNRTVKKYAPNALKQVLRVFLIYFFKM